MTAENLPIRHNIEPHEYPNQLVGLELTDMQPFANALVAFGVDRDEVGSWQVYSDHIPEAGPNEIPEKTVVLHPHILDFELSRSAINSSSPLQANKMRAQAFPDYAAHHAAFMTALAVRRGSESRIVEVFRSGSVPVRAAGFISGLGLGLYAFESPLSVALSAGAGTYMALRINRQIVNIPNRHARKEVRRLSVEDPQTMDLFRRSIRPTYTRH